MEVVVQLLLPIPIRDTADMATDDVDIVLNRTRLDIIRNRMIRITRIVRVPRVAPTRDVVIRAEACVRSIVIEVRNRRP